MFCVVKQEGEPDHVPWWHALTVSILLPDIGLIGTVGRVDQACIASSHDALVTLSSEKDEILPYLNNGLMVPLGFSLVSNATKHGLWAQLQTKILLFSGNLFKQVLAFLCNSSKADQSLHQAKVSSLKKTMFGWNPSKTIHRGSINLMRGCSSLSHCLRPHIWSNTWCLVFTESTAGALHRLGIFPTASESSRDCQHIKISLIALQRHTILFSIDHLCMQLTTPSTEMVWMKHLFYCYLFIFSCHEFEYFHVLWR